MNKPLIYLVSIITLLSYSCSDTPEIIYNIIPVEVKLGATNSDFESLNIDFQGVRIYSEFGIADTLSTTQAGVQDMRMWENNQLQIADFELSYDSISIVELVFGQNNSLELNGQTFDLPFQNNSDHSLRIPVDRYIQDQSEIEISLEFNSMLSVIEQANDEYLLAPQVTLKN